MRHTIFCRILVAALVLTLAGWVGAPNRLLASPVPAGALAGAQEGQDGQGAGLLAQLRLWLSAMWPAAGPAQGLIKPHATCTFDPNGSQHCTSGARTPVIHPAATCTFDPNGVQHCSNS